MRNEKIGSGEPKLETGISFLLMVGVIISLILEIAGVILLYQSYRSLAISQNESAFIRGNDFFTFIFQQFQGKHSSGIGMELMTIGIIVLILTPYIRLITSVVYFGWEKNLKYVFITLFVLVVITLSLALH